MLSSKLVAAATIVLAAAATPYSVRFQDGTATMVENTADCYAEGGTCKDAGCRNGTEACAVLTSGTVCLDKAEEQVDQIDAGDVAESSEEAVSID